MKKLFLGFFVLVIVLLLVSCVTTTNVFDKDHPLEQSATLKIMLTITIHSYNGIDVELETPYFVSPAFFTNFIIPAGRATLVMDLDHTVGYRFVTYYLARNIPLSYDFEAGETYRLVFAFTDADKRMTESENIPAIVLVKESDQKTPLIMIQLNTQQQSRTVLD
jgi:hypothetical protein